FELTGFPEADLMGRDVVEALHFSDAKPVELAREWGVRRLNEQLSIRTPAGCSSRSRPGAADLDPARRAQLGGERAVLATGPARVADAAAVPDEKVWEPRPVLARHEPDEVALDLHGILLPREREPLREPADVGVDDDSLRGAALGRDDVGGLPRHARELQELVERLRHLAVVVLEQPLHRPAQRLRLLAIEPGRVDVALELLDRHREVVLRPAVLPEEVLGDAVDVHVGGLRREQHRHEELQRVLEAKRDPRVGVLDGEPLDHGTDPLLLRSDALASRLGEIAPRHQRRMLTARAATSSSVTIDTADCSSMSIFARRVSGIVSVGLNALAFVKARYR